VGRAIAKKDDHHLVVIKSTVVPTTTENVVIPVLENYSEKKAGGVWSLYESRVFNRDFKYMR